MKKTISMRLSLPVLNITVQNPQSCCNIVRYQTGVEIDDQNTWSRQLTQRCAGQITITKLQWKNNYSETIFTFVEFTVYNLQNCSNIGTHQTAVKTDRKFWVHQGVRSHPDDPIKSLIIHISIKSEIFVQSLYLVWVTRSATPQACNRSLRACNFIKKENLTQVFFCEFCEISKNTFFTEHLWAAVLEFVLNNVLFVFYNNIFEEFKKSIYFCTGFLLRDYNLSSSSSKFFYSSPFPSKPFWNWFQSTYQNKLIAVYICRLLKWSDNWISKRFT